MIYYTVSVRFPNEKANGKQIKEVCNSLVEHTQVTLVVPARRTHVPLEGFGLDSRVRMAKMPVIDLVRFRTFGQFGWLITISTFMLSASVYLLGQKLRGKCPVVITRDFFCALAVRVILIPTAWESHRGEWNIFVRFISKLKVQFFVISHGLKDLYLSKGVKDSQITLVPDGVDLSRYQDLPSKEHARQQLGLDQNKLIVVYNGHLHTWKGANTLAEAARYLGDDAEVIFMGGSEEDIKKFKEKYASNPIVSIIGRRDDQTRPIYLRAADALILPNTAKNEISVKYTSPLKLFGYMAAEVPIIASDLPSIREVVTEEKVFFAEADNPESFAEVILYVHHNPEEALRRAQNARKLVEGFSWDVRAAKVIEVLKNVSHYKEG